MSRCQNHRDIAIYIAKQIFNLLAINKEPYMKITRDFLKKVIKEELEKMEEMEGEMGGQFATVFNQPAIKVGDRYVGIQTVAWKMAHGLSFEQATDPNNYQSYEYAQEASVKKPLSMSMEEFKKEAEIRKGQTQEFLKYEKRYGQGSFTKGT